VIETEQELLRVLATRKLPRWVARIPNTDSFYVTGEPFPAVTPDVVLTAAKHGVLIEHVSGLWAQPQDIPPPPTPRRGRRPKRQ
jgi:hypothetical protein